MRHIFYLFLVIFTVGFSSHAIAQITLPPQITNGRDVLENLQGGTLDLGQATGQIANLGNLSLPNAQQLLQSVINNPSIDVSSGGQLIDSFIDGTIPIAELGNVTQALDTIRERIADPEVINNLVQNIASTALPPELAQAATLINDLDQLGDINSLADALEIPAVREAFENILNQTGLVANATEALSALSALTDLIVDPQAFIGQTLDQISENLLQTLQNALPDVFSDILEGFQGDISELITSLGLQILGNFDLGGLTIPAGVTGDYELYPRNAHSSPVGGCGSPLCASCTCRRPIEQNHITIRAHHTDEFIRHRTWMIDVFFREHVHYALALMTQQLSGVMMKQAYIVGKFFDAKHQQETQRLFQQLMAEAHRDYYPSEALCEIGTNTRSLAGSEDKTTVAQRVFARRVQDRSLRSSDVLSTQGAVSDSVSKIQDFRAKYCNVNDNARGLSWLCAGETTERERRNKDINFTQTLLSELTIDADYVNTDSTDDPDGEDVLALTTNLFSHELFPTMERLTLATEDGRPKSEATKYLDLRAVLAKKSVAENTFSSIVAERVRGLDSGAGGPGDSDINYSFMRRILVDLGVPEDEINEFLGLHPSYFAQRKVLTNYVFENPVFYTELYESAANIVRKETAIKALNLMLEDDMFDRQLESEATLAVLLETMLEDEHIRISRSITNLEPGRN